jgi:hypothetical protein
LLQAVGQAVAGKATLERQIAAGIEAFVNIAVYEPAVVSLLQGEAETVPALAERRSVLRETQVSTWQRPLDVALDRGQIPPQNTRRTAEALTGAFDEVVLNLLEQPDARTEAAAATADMTHFALRAVGLLPILKSQDGPS